MTPTFRSLLTRIIGFATLLLFLNSPVLGQSRLIKTGWQLDPEFSEDFDPGTTTAGLAARWNFEYAQGPVFANESQESFETYNTPANITFANGYAYFNTYYQATPILANGREYHYTSACLVSKHDDYPDQQPGWWNGIPGGALFGMCEIRCKLPAVAGQTASLWLLGHNEWPPEIDVFEYNPLYPKLFTSTIHWDDKTQGTHRHEGGGGTYPYSYNLYDDFHTWTMVWTPFKVTWFFEGIELRSDTVRQHIPGSGFEQKANFWNLVKEHKMDIVVCSGLSYPDASQTTFSPLIVDYIHTYRPVAALPAYAPSQNLDNYYHQTLLPAYQYTPYTRAASYWKRLVRRQLDRWKK